MSTTNNYLVTFGDVATMGFTSKAAYPGGYNANKVMTKGEVDTYWFVDTTVAAFAGYTSLRCPRYQDLQNTTTTTSTTTTAAPTTTTTTTAAATTTTSTTTTAAPTTTTSTTTSTSTSTTTTLAPGLTTTTSTTTTEPPTTTTTSTSTTTEPPTTTTTTSTTTTAAPISYSIGVQSFNGGYNYTGYSTSNDACNAGGTNPLAAVFSSGTIGNGEVLYLDSNLTNAFTSTGGYYWASGGIGIYYYFNYVGGVITNFAYCAATTTSTSTTTTEAPTTTTTTTTEAPTTTTTTTTEAPTTTTTSTTVAPLFKYSAASANDACTGGLTMTNVILDNTGLCNSTTITCNEFLSEAAAITIWISFAGDVREATINDPNTYGEATFVAACVACSATTTTTTVAPTTTTTTTAAPTYDYYTAEEYACSTGTTTGNNAVLVAFPYNSSITTSNTYYRTESIPGNVYKNFTAAGSGAAIIMIIADNDTDYNTPCDAYDVEA